jgi:hypothetical protein
VYVCTRGRPAPADEIALACVARRGAAGSGLDAVARHAGARGHPRGIAMRSLRHWILPAVVTAAALTLAFARPAAERPGFEYHVARYGSVDISAEPKKQDEQVAALQAQLNAWAADGWELAFVQGGFAILRR